MSDDRPLLADGFGEALIGVGTRFNAGVAVYDWDKCVKILMERDGLAYDEAVEHMDFNVTGAYVGPHTPIFVHHRTLRQFYECNGRKYEPHP